MPTMIEISQLQKCYGNKQVLKGIDLRVSQGDFYGFIGPNGAGKSTTIKILLGLVSKTGGHARICDIPVGPSKLEILENIAYLPSEVNLYPNLTVKEILDVSQSLSRSQQDNERTRLVEVFRLDLDKKIKELSLGNRKKVGIVLMLMKDAALYIMDEPTSGLDPLMQQIFWDEVQAKHAQGKTIFVSSHILSEVQRYCNKAAFIKNGSIILTQDLNETTIENIKKVRLDGIFQMTQEKGMSHISQDEFGTSFHYQGDISCLLRLIDKYREKISDVHIQNLDIENVFMHYYQDAEGDIS